MRLPTPSAPAWLRLFVGFIGFLLLAAVSAAWFGWRAVGVLEWLGLPVGTVSEAVRFFAGTDKGRLITLAVGVLFILYALRARSVSDVQMQNRTAMLNRWSNFIDFHYPLLSFRAAFTDTDTYQEMRHYLRRGARRQIARAGQDKAKVRQIVGDEIHRLAKKWGLV